jgi:hypothetical protein
MSGLFAAEDEERILFGLGEGSEASPIYWAINI